MVKGFFSNSKARAISTLRQDQNKADTQGLYLLVILALFAFALIISTSANAIGTNAAANCAADYFRLCSQNPIGTPAAAQCLIDNSEKLAEVCVNALVTDTEISKEDVAKINNKRSIASTKIEEVKEVKPTETVKASDVVEKVKSKTRNIVDRLRSATKDVVKAVDDEIKYVKKSIKKATTPNKRVAAKNKKEATKRKRKLQQGGKWDGYPLFLEWNDGGQRVYGGELTPYGYEDRR